MRMIRFKKLLRIAALILLPIAVCAWVITLVRWYQENKSFEPINAVIAIVVSGLWAALAFSGSKMHSNPTAGSDSQNSTIVGGHNKKSIIAIFS